MTITSQNVPPEWLGRPEPTEPPIGTVLAYVVQLGQRTTGSSTQQGVNWAALVRALRAKQARVSISTHWQEWSL